MDKPIRPVTPKSHALIKLCQLRQSSRWPRYNALADYHNGVYECNFVSPYTRSAGNTDAELMVMLQDWASDEVLRGEVLEERVRLGHDPARITNRRLKELLQGHFGLGLAEVYATNLFPFIKRGRMSSAIPFRDLVRAAREFGWPQVEIVRPRTLVCLGLGTFSAMGVAAGRPRATRLDEAIDLPFTHGGVRVWCQAHTGQQGTNMRNAGGVDRVAGDWEGMPRQHRGRG